MLHWLKRERVKPVEIFFASGLRFLTTQEFGSPVLRKPLRNLHHPIPVIARHEATNSI
jgi:hypothetical protein